MLGFVGLVVVFATMAFFCFVALPLSVEPVFLSVLFPFIWAACETDSSSFEKSEGGEVCEEIVEILETIELVVVLLVVEIELGEGENDVTLLVDLVPSLAIRLLWLRLDILFSNFGTFRFSVSACIPVSGSLPLVYVTEHVLPLAVISSVCLAELFESFGTEFVEKNMGEEVGESKHRKGSIQTSSSAA